MRWVASTSTWSDTLFTIRESDRLCVIVPSMGDTIPVPFPLDRNSSWSTPHYLFQTLDASISSQLEMQADRIGSPSVQSRLWLRKHVGLWGMTRRDDIPGVRRREISVWLENHTIAGNTPPNPGIYGAK